MLDKDGQPLIKQYGKKRLNDRTIDELIGLAKGISADNKINQAEAEFLLNWMTRNAAYSDDKIVNILYSRIKDILSDNVLDSSEKAELLSILKDISGEHCPAEKAEVTSAKFPLDKPQPAIEILGSTFCFTGKFAYGPRKECEKVVIEIGGSVKGNVTHTTDYLVIGTLCSSEWIHTSYGRKIEKAMEMRDNPPSQRLGDTIAIIHEDHWAKYAFKN